jgi:hypothetical protein
VRRLLPLLGLLLLTSPAAAATIQGGKQGGLLAGTPRPDRLVGGQAAARVAVGYKKKKLAA